ncbi:MAG: site-2 protease family protein, partial [Cyanobacteria bacterium P01_A01_bin.105]
MILGLVSFVAVAALVWGYNRTKPYGKLGLLSWLQSVSLIAPWLLLFSLFAMGFYPNLAVALLLVVLSAGAYIALGRQIRLMDTDPIAAQRAVAIAEPDAAAADGTSRPDAMGHDMGHENPETQPSADAPTHQADAPTPQRLAISPEDMAVIEGIFSIDTFFRTGTFPYQTGAYFQGNLRGQPDQTA